VCEAYAASERRAFCGNVMSTDEGILERRWWAVRLPRVLRPMNVVIPAPASPKKAERASKKNRGSCVTVATVKDA